MNVSIHTPTWGVTYNFNVFKLVLHVSIHTPTWGVTCLFTIPLCWTKGFNPHTYMRCDVEIDPVSKFCIVSIHTPTWGVTDNMFTLRYCNWFQSTHLHEVWLRSLWTRRFVKCFNPHTYMRCDYHLPRNVCSIPCFNPHTYMRCDPY